jgi:hypothetical protein
MYKFFTEKKNSYDSGGGGGDDSGTNNHNLCNVLAIESKTPV